MLNLTNPIGLIRPETIEFGSGTVSAAGRWAKARGLRCALVISDAFNAGRTDVLELPADRARPKVASGRGGRVAFEIPASVANRIGELARDAGVTPFMVVHAALAVLLSRMAATDDVAVGTPVAGRGRAELDPMIGMFVNTLVLRTAVGSGDSFEALLERVRDVDLDAFAHSDVPFETVVERMNPVRSESFAPLAQVWLTLDQSVVPELAGSGLAGGEVADVRVTPVEVPQLTAKVDALFGIGTAGPGQPWPAVIQYATDLFDERSVARLADRFVAVLTACVHVSSVCSRSSG